jgi:Uma2 family endonuclease
MSEVELMLSNCDSVPAVAEFHFVAHSKPSHGATQSTRQWTEEDLQALPDNGYIHEVINGELIISPKNSFEHADICIRLATALNAHARSHRSGVVLDSSTGFWMSNRNCRAPDISFVSKQRLKGLKRPPKAFFQGAPDLAVEIVAPSNTPIELTARLQDYFSSGTRLAWLIHHDQKFVEVCRSAIDRKLLASGAMLDGEDVLPGFQYPIPELFTEWNWD